MIRFLTAALLATTMLGAVAPALAVTETEAAEHNVLINTLQGHGISVFLNADECAAGNLSGFYHSPSKSLVLCNQGSREMTDENLDTLRHESIHVAQDCRNGIKGDKNMQRILKPGAAQLLADEAGLNLDRIREVYLGNGMDEYVVLLEYEAFAAAATMDAATIAQALDIFCSAAQ